MKVYTNYRSGGYSGGLIVVAANSPEEAHGTMYRDADKFDAEQYKFDTWKELPDVEYHGEHPKMLDECGYTE
ncbi:MAG: hypothetical protein ACI30A_06565 [Paludibacteraceae bacterium]